MTVQTHQQLASFIWSICNLLRGPYKRNEYRKVILPLTVLRRFDCILAPTKAEVLEKYEKVKERPDKVVQSQLCSVAGMDFYNISKLDFSRLLDDPNHLAKNVAGYISAFSTNVRDIMDRFSFGEQIARMAEKNLLYEVIKAFANIDLSPACGTGGMLSIAEEYIRSLNAKASLHLFGQDWNDEAWAICRSDMLIKGENADNIVLGDSFEKDGFTEPQHKFDYMLANPPFGVEWKQQQKFIEKEAERGYQGRFGAGLPRVNDGALLFLQHMISKMRSSDEGGSRIGIIFNGSPLFTGDAGSGESEIRKWIITNDWLEAVVALPEQLFYNTGISTYLWILSNRKEPERKGMIQLIDARQFYVKMRKSLGNKRNEIGDGTSGRPEQIGEITRIYSNFRHDETREVSIEGRLKKRSVSKIFKNEEFGFYKITVERPRRLNFAFTEERIARLENEPVFQKLATSQKHKEDQRLAETEAGKQRQEEIRTFLKGLAKIHGEILFSDSEQFLNLLKSQERKADFRLDPAERKAIVAALSERDETAEICRDGKGDPEPDPELRDTETVPLTEEIEEYFKREVLPHVPDAWIDEKKTKVGYEIPLNRHFYVYEPPRELEQIEADIKGLEASILALLKEVV